MADAGAEELAAVLPGGGRQDGVGPGAASRPVAARRVRWFALRRDIPQGAYVTLAGVSFLSAFLLWQWVSHQSFVNPVFVPSPEKVWRAAIDFWSDSIRAVISSSRFATQYICSPRSCTGYSSSRSRSSTHVSE